MEGNLKMLILKAFVTSMELCKTRENSIFLNKGKTVISVENQEIF